LSHALFNFGANWAFQGGLAGQINPREREATTLTQNDSIAAALRSDCASKGALGLKAATEKNLSIKKHGDA
jgi:hypothetical protein